MLDLKHAKTFIAVAQAGTFCKAPQELDVAQPTVSLHIKSLEKSLGYDLYDRIGKYAVMTPSGEQFLPAARELIRISEEAKLLGSHTQDLSGSLTLCIVQSVCTYLMPPILKTFRSKHPNISVHITVNRPSVYMLEQLRSGDFDASIVLENRFDIPSLISKSLWSDQLRVITYPEHPLAKKTVVSWSSLEPETFILPEKDAYYRKLFERRLREEELSLSNSFEIDNIEAIKQCVMAGLGLAIVPAYAVKNEVASKKLVLLNLEGRPLRVTAQIIWHKDKLMRNATKAFIDLITHETDV